jgi:hypothetical protein
MKDDQRRSDFKAKMIFERKEARACGRVEKIPEAA